MRKERILVLEDEYLVGLNIVADLEDAGFVDVGYVQTEAQALDALQRLRWDLVVADANLNGTSVGFVLAHLQEEAIPFVVVSGHDRGALPLAAAQALLLPKPFTPVALVRAVNHTLRHW